MPRIDITTSRRERIGGATPARVKQAYFDGVRETLLPELKKRVPRQTGRLQASLRYVRRGDEVGLRGIHYAPYVVFALPLGRGYKRTGDLRTVKAVADRLLAVNHNRLLRNAIMKVIG